MGKTEWSLSVAEALGAPILSADSRQIYREMTIGTAAPTPEQLQRVPHHFIASFSPETYYSASKYEQDALKLLDSLFQAHPTVVMTGGSMMYIDAVCRGIDDIPTIDVQLREKVQERYQREGLDGMRALLKLLDPKFYGEVDLKNPKRVIHAVEICLMVGKPYSSLRMQTIKKRPFRIVKIGLFRERQELYERINQRVNVMIENGLIKEVESLYPKRNLNALNTVGYKELFDYFDGNSTLNQAIDKIKQHSRNYARKQMTWFKKDKDMFWINLSDNRIDVMKEIMNRLE